MRVCVVCLCVCVTKSLSHLPQSGDLYVWGSNGRGEAGLLNPALALVPTLNTNLPKEAGGVTHLATARASVMVATASGDAYVWGEHFPYTSVYNPNQGGTIIRLIAFPFFCKCDPEFDHHLISLSDVKTPFGKDAPKGAKASVPNQIVWTPVIALWDQNRTWRVTAVAIGHSHLLFLSDDGQGMPAHTFVLTVNTPGILTPLT